MTSGMTFPRMLDGSAGGVQWMGTRWYWLWFAPNEDGRELAVIEQTRWVDEMFYFDLEFAERRGEGGA